MTVEIIPDDHTKKFLDLLDDVKEAANGWLARCPAHEDHTPSLSIRQADDGRVLLRCFAGCPVEEIVAAVGLTTKDLFPGDGGGGGRPPSKSSNTSPHLTLAEYAQAKGLPEDFLRALGVGEFFYQGQPALRMPYLDADSVERAVRFRLALTGDAKFRWRKGAKPCLYGLWQLAKARKAGHVLIVEGESDPQTLWFYGYPTVGVPGANAFRSEWAEELAGIERVYVVVEPDRGGEALWESLASSPLKERLYRIELPEGIKDVSDLHVKRFGPEELSDPERFRFVLKSAMESAVSFMDIAETEAEEKTRDAWAECEDLATAESILDLFAEDVKRSGVAGESNVVKLLYLAVNSRLLDSTQLVNVAVKGPSGAGKSYLTEKVLGFFPNEAYFFLTAMSERALAYSTEPIAHRFLVLAEAAGMSGDFQTYLIRSLLSEGKLRYETVEKSADGGLESRIIEREGPTGLIVTTTAVKLHAENETRMLTVNVSDTAEHTSEILMALADEEREPIDPSRWHALQVWLSSGEHEVTVPFGTKLAGMIPPVAVRLRRDFGAILNLIRSHALLHRASRERDSRGRIIASIEDYAVVRELVADLISENVGATVPATVRETVAAVERLAKDSGGDPVNNSEVGRELKLDRSAARLRLQRALEEGFLRNLEDRKNRTARLVVGDPLPGERPLLPEPEQLGCGNVVGVLGGTYSPSPPDDPDGDLERIV